MQFLKKLDDGGEQWYSERRYQWIIYSDEHVGHENSTSLSLDNSLLIASLHSCVTKS